MAKKKSWLHKLGKLSKRVGREMSSSKLAKSARTPVKLNKKWY